MNRSMAHVVLGLAVILLASCASPASPGLHTNELRSLLTNQGFSSSLEPQLRFKKVGSVSAAHTRFDVYYYEHVTTEMQAPRSIQRLVVIREGQTYLGSYLVDDDPTNVARVAGSDIIFDFPFDGLDDLGIPGFAARNRIRFDESGPPKSVLLNGSYATLEK